MDSILSVRISEEVKAKFLKLAEEQGVNNKEFLDLIIKGYEMNKTVADVDFVKNDIDELQTIIKRVVDIYLNIIDKNKIRTLEATNNYQASLTEEQSKSETFKNEVVIAKKNLETLLSDNKKLKENIEELKVQLAKGKEDLKEFKEMNSFLKEKSAEYSSIKSSYEELRSTNKALTDDVHQLKEERIAFIKEIDDLKNSNSLLLDKLNTSESGYQLKVIEFQDSFNTKIQLKDSEFNLRLQTQLLEKEQGLREEIWSLKSEYDKKISQLLREKEELILKISLLSQERQ